MLRNTANALTRCTSKYAAGLLLLLLARQGEQGLLRLLPLLLLAEGGSRRRHRLSHGDGPCTKGRGRAKICSRAAKPRWLAKWRGTSSTCRSYSVTMFSTLSRLQATYPKLEGQLTAESAASAKSSAGRLAHHSRRMRTKRAHHLFMTDPFVST